MEIGTIGRLHRREGDWVIIIVEHQGRDVRAIFRADEVMITGEGNAEMVAIREEVERRVLDDNPDSDGQPVYIRKNVSVIPADVTWVNHRHQVPVIVPQTVFEKITAQAERTTLTLTRP